jgi:phosphotriesterase-related protein
MTDDAPRPECRVMTVLGAIAPEQLGRTLFHEHCVIDLRVWFVEPTPAPETGSRDGPIEMGMLADLRRRPFSTVRDNLVLDDQPLAIEELNRYVRAGGKSVVDVTPLGLGRDPLALQRLAHATGLHIVMATGLYVENAHPDWVKEKNADELATFMIGEVRDGVAGTDVRAGIIGEIGLSGLERGSVTSKVGAITSEEEKVLRAAGRAAIETGLAVSLHIDPREPRAGLPAIDVLESEGVPAARIVVGHMDQVDDLDYHLAIAARGVGVEYDSFGREHYSEEWGYDFNWGHDSRRIQLVQELVRRGHASQLVFSQDVCMKTDLRAYGGYGYAHVLTDIVPMLRAGGVSEADINAALIENPARLLAAPPSELMDGRRQNGTEKPTARQDH